MLNPCYFTDENSKTGFKINLDNHNCNHAISILTVQPNFPDFEIEF